MFAALMTAVVITPLRRKRSAVTWAMLRESRAWSAALRIVCT